MEENENFINQLQEAIKLKTEWFNTVRLQEMASQYRLLQSCVKNLYDMLVKKTLIIPDPYRLDKKMSDIVVPETSSFTEGETMSVLGSRFSEYDVMLDFICTYFRFSVDNLPLPKVKKMIDFNNVFDWTNFSTNSSKPNTRALANVLNTAKTNAPSVIVSMITDSIVKNSEASMIINKCLNELGAFQKELYKYELRKDLFEHPDFHKDKAFTSPEAELAEIKRIYVKVMGKKPFYSDLIGEIIQEDLGQNKEKHQSAVLESLKIPTAIVKKTVNKGDSVSFHELQMGIVLAVAAMSPTLTQLRVKLVNNFNILYEKKKTFFSKLRDALKKVFHIREREKVCAVQVTDQKTGGSRIEKIKVNELLFEINKKERIYAAVSNRGPEFEKIDSSSEDAILQFVNKQISETQSLFTKINALDGYFKNSVPVESKTRIKGMQIELSAMRNSIINANKKRGEYVSAKEETEQMQKLGISDNI